MSQAAVAVLDAADADEAIEQIAEAVEAFGRGGPDSEADCVRLGSRFGLKLDPIKAQWAEARRANAARVTVLPPAKSAAAQSPAAQSTKSVRRDLTAYFARQAQEEAEHEARIAAVRALAKAKAASLRSQSTIAPAPSEAPKPEPSPKLEEPKPPPPPLILNPSSPLDSAREFIKRECPGPDGKTNLYHWQGQFYQWNGIYYRLLDVDVLEGQVLAFLDRAMKYAGGNAGLVRFQPGSRHVNEVTYALSKCLALGRDFAPPSWFDSEAAS